MTRQQINRLAQSAITLMAILVVLPIVLVIFYVVYNGIGAIWWEFLFTAPRNGMREGGIMAGAARYDSPDLRHGDGCVSRWRLRRPSIWPSMPTTIG